MKLTSIEAKKISEDYNLGAVKSLKIIPGGCVNYNFLLKTETGFYILRGLGRKDKKTEKRLGIEFKLINHLQKKNYPYGIPIPIKNSKGKYISSINGERVWIYKKLPGVHSNRFTNIQLKQVAKAVATYHRYVKDFPIKGKLMGKTYSQLKKRYSQMSKIKPKNKVDKMMLEALPMFQEILKKYYKINFSKNSLWNHRDIHRHNVLFKKGEISGIIDFECIDYGPRINDLAHITKTSLFENGQNLSKERFNLFLREYEKINPLTKQERKLILPWLIKHNCNMFEYFYTHCFDGKVPDVGCLKWTIDTTKGALKELI